jgi:DNA-binding transcriptional LysR family regulator
MNFRDLEYLVVSAAEGNFSRAARSLGISTSTISRRIARLEDDLGLAVFERGHKGIRLTTGGRAVLLHARRAAAELQALRVAGKRNGSGAVGEVRLGLRMAPIGEPILYLLAGWRQSCTDVLLTIFEMNERDLAIALEERRLDAALVPAWMVSRRAAALPVYRESLFAALPAQHPLVERERMGWPALVGETVLVQGWDESQAERDFLAPMMGPDVDIRSHAASKLSILALVALGFGITIVPQGLAEAPSPALPTGRSTSQTLCCRWISCGCQKPRSRRSAGSSPSCVTRRGHVTFAEFTAVRPNFAKARSVAMKRASIGAINFAGSTWAWPVSRPSASA